MRLHPPNATANRWLTVDQVSNRLQVSTRTIYRWMLGRNPLPTRKIRGFRRVSEAELEAWITRTSR